MKKLKNLKPTYIENSIIPKILSYFAPITIGAIAIFPFVFSRGKISETTRTHEAIHFQQQLETLVIGFYALYFWDYLKARFKGLKGKEAYYLIRAEREAYVNETFPDYLQTRKRWEWLRSN